MKGQIKSTLNPQACMNYVIRVNEANICQGCTASGKSLSTPPEKSEVYNNTILNDAHD